VSFNQHDQNKHMQLNTSNFKTILFNTFTMSKINFFNIGQQSFCPNGWNFVISWKPKNFDCPPQLGNCWSYLHNVTILPCVPTTPIFHGRLLWKSFSEKDIAKGDPMIIL
jgi:hypothetical protein